jgi:ABC-type sugar transport system substrate-binding protein
MTRRPKSVVAAGAVLAAALALAACGGSGGSTTASTQAPAGSSTTGSTTTASTGAIKPYPGFEKDYPNSFPVPKPVSGKKFTIGCQNPVGAGNETTTTFCKGVEAEAKALGMSYVGVDDALSVDKQVSNFNQLLAQGANAIVLYPLAPDALRASLAKAKSQGVAVIGLNVTFTKSAKAPGYDAQVWEGRDQEAYLSVAQMAQLAPHGKVVIVGIGAPVPAIKYLAQRYRYWAGKFGLQVLGEQDNPSDDIAGGQKAMTGLLGQFGDIDGVLAYNDESAVGAYTAARGEGRTGLKIIGINGSSLGLSALKDGHVSAIVQVDAVNQGAQAAGAAYDVLTKQGLPLPNVVVRGPKLITKDNIGSVASWKDELAAIKPGNLSK